MDHSVQGYLQRMSTEELEGALQYYLREDQIDDHHDAIRDILNELQRRHVSTELTPRERELFEKFLQRRKDIYHL